MHESNSDQRKPKNSQIYFWTPSKCDDEKLESKPKINQLLVRAPQQKCYSTSLGTGKITHIDNKNNKFEENPKKIESKRSQILEPRSSNFY